VFKIILKNKFKERPLSQIIKKINKENAPPGGWRPEDKATSFKRQASSLTTGLGCCRMNLERNNYGQRNNRQIS